MKRLLFPAAYWITSILTGLAAIPLLLLPGRKALMKLMKTYSRAMLFWMNRIGRVEVKYEETHHMPEGACIIASKHQSWGDGYTIFSQFDDLAFVTGDHLEKLPVVKHILRKMQAIVVASCGGPEVRARLMGKEMEKARSENRRILIYPEGRLVPPGEAGEYKKGVYHMYEAYGCPVVPVATNLGLFWPDEGMKLNPGVATVRFLEPIQPGLDKDAFMALLEERIETTSNDLLPAEMRKPAEAELALAA